MIKAAEHNRMTFEVVQYTGKNYDECTAFIDSNGMWPHIDMKAADDSYTVGWNASQVDMLAEDWQLA